MEGDLIISGYQGCRGVRWTGAPKVLSSTKEHNADLISQEHNALVKSTAVYMVVWLMHGAQHGIHAGGRRPWLSLEPRTRPRGCYHIPGGVAQERLGRAYSETMPKEQAEVRSKGTRWRAERLRRNRDYKSLVFTRLMDDRCR